MKELFVVALILSLVSVSLLLAWLDNKHNWRLIDWFNGRCDNPFKAAQPSQFERQIKDKEAKIAELTERVQVLERIVTEPAHELNKKINNL